MLDVFFTKLQSIQLKSPLAKPTVILYAANTRTYLTSIHSVDVYKYFCDWDIGWYKEMYNLIFDIIFLTITTKKQQSCVCESKHSKT